MAELSVDELSLFLRKDYQITDKIAIHHPTLQEIAEFGEQRYYSTVFVLTCIPSDMKHQLEDIGMNYMKVPDYDLFLYLTRGLKQSDTSLLFGDLYFSKMEPAKDENTGEVVLVDLESGTKIDRFVYINMMMYLRKMHGIVPKVEKAANEMTRKMLIKFSREDAERAKRKPWSSQLKPIISGLMRSPSCGLSLDDILNLPIYVAMDTIMGIQVFTATNALLIGSYSGMVDTSKINKKEFDWMRDAQDTAKRQVLNSAAQTVTTK